MNVSVFDLFSIGIGPSSSHTVGPMRAARRFCIEFENLISQAVFIKAELFGSLALTGKGHGTDMAVLMGLSGYEPQSIDPDQVPRLMGEIISQGKIKLLEKFFLNFNTQDHLIFHSDKTLDRHSNGLIFSLIDSAGKILATKTYYSIGGGFVITDTDQEFLKDKNLENQTNKIPYFFKSAQDLLAICSEKKLNISDVMLANEKTWRSELEIEQGLIKIWQVMEACIKKGSQTDGILPGGLKVKRRAHQLFLKLACAPKKDEMNWINLFAIAVNEENAAGGRVVTAPTNGAAGIIPAVMKYFDEFEPGGMTPERVKIFMLTAAAVGILFKEGASISAAEVGCQGEVGVACSMAAAGLAALWGGTVAQIENAAEIGMEHHLGLTCDPIGGLVQIPCIERNTMGAIQAVNSAKLALLGDGTHLVSLDMVIKTMRETGHDMASKYKETALGGLAVNMPAC